MEVDAIPPLNYLRPNASHNITTPQTTTIFGSTYNTINLNLRHGLNDDFQSSSKLVIAIRDVNELPR